MPIDNITVEYTYELVSNGSISKKFPEFFEMVNTVGEIDNEFDLLNASVIQNWEVPELLLTRLLDKLFPFKSDALRDFVSKSSSEYILLKFAVKCFNQFLQANWTGPPLEKVCFQHEESATILDSLSIDGEEIYSGCLYKELLLGTISLLDILSEVSSLNTVSIWRARVYFVWQRVLSDSNDRGQGNCPSLMSVCLNEYVSALGAHKYLSADLLANLQAHLTPVESFTSCPRLPIVSDMGSLHSEFLLELVVRLLYYGKIDSVRPLLDYVASLLEVEVHVTGVEGIKRQFQTVAFAQMAARVVHKAAPKIFLPANGLSSLLLSSYDVTTDILENVLCEPDTVNPEELCSPLSALEQCLLICEALRFWYGSNSRDELNLESVHALGVRIIAGGSSSWTPFSSSLLLRSRSEFFKNSTRGRACFQTDTLVAQFGDATAEPESRLAFLHATGYPSLWELQRENGTRMMEVGMVVTACEMFKKLAMWPLVMDCLAVAGRKAEALDLLAQLETTQGTLSARLLCSKGDMTGDPQYYELAWELSKKTHARAQRSLGRFWLKNGDLEKAVASFQLSLAINPLFDDIWFSLGSIYLRMGDQDEASINAFVRCVGINPEHVQAWVNLSAVYQRFPDRLGEAKNAAAEAVKLSPQAWQFWENFVLICARAGDWQNVIRGELKLSIGPLRRLDRPDMDIVELMLARTGPKDAKVIEFLETLVLNNKQSPRILALLAKQYTELGEMEKAMKTRTLELKELLAACNGEQGPLDALQFCLLEVYRIMQQNKALGLGLGLTVRSIPRRVGQGLPNLTELCQKIETHIRQIDSIPEAP